jgi:geranylgeranyl reductase family protein
VKDVVIAGAGPAGISCAVALVRKDPSLRGRVLVLDRARFPRSKPCGGGLTGHVEQAMRALGLELTVPFSAAPRARVAFGSLTRDVTLERPVRVVRREEFDASLVAQARDLGVEVRESTALEGFRVERDGVELSAGGASVRARVLIGADGAGSAVRKRIQEARTAERPELPRETPIRLFRAELASSDWPRDLMLYDFTPMTEGLRGYLWVFPVPGDRINVGLMHEPSIQKSGAELTAMLETHLRRLGIRLGVPARGWPAWRYRRTSRLSRDRLILCGDAAGIDALTGEGIAIGMEQALVCADSVCDALARGDFRFRGYARRLRRATVGRELALDGWLARLLYGGLAGAWERWLSLVLCDPQVLELYAARVCGSLVLADHKRALMAALLRHLVRAGGRRRQLALAGEVLV